MRLRDFESTITETRSHARILFLTLSFREPLQDVGGDVSTKAYFNTFLETNAPSQNYLKRHLTLEMRFFDVRTMREVEHSIYWTSKGIIVAEVMLSILYKRHGIQNVQCRG